MAREPRVVAELGRPETPDETAARRAESSRVHRQAQNTRNLVAALLVTLGVVAVIIFAVPRGTPPAAEPIDVAAVAEGIAEVEGHGIVAPEVPEEWRVNSARLEGDSPRTFTVVYAPEQGFIRVVQGFEADEGWPSRVLRGADADGTVTIDGVTWTRYDIPDPERAGNVSAALSTPAGDDIVMIYGMASDEILEEAARGVASQVKALQEEQE